MKNCLLFLTTLALLLLACEPQQDADIELGALPEPPTFTAVISGANPNQVILTNTADGFFDHVWDLPGATPARSEKLVDTIFYQKAGVYTITLHAAKTGGNGTSQSSQTVTIAQDAQLACDPLVSDLTGECTSKCWQLTNTPGAVKVGPQPLSSEWFSSNGLEATQLDDRWCFTFEDAVHEYKNNGSSFSSCQGYVEVPNYPVPAGVKWALVPSGTPHSQLKIVLDNADSWIGVEDSGPEYEIVSVTETQLVLLSAIKPCDGAPSTGWFTLTFLKG